MVLSGGCCLEFPIPAGCQCFLVKTKPSEEHSAYLASVSNEVKAKADNSERESKVTDSKETQLKSKAAGLAKGDPQFTTRTE